MRITGTRKAGNVQGLKKSKSTAADGGDFRITGSGENASDVGQVAAAAPTETLSALITLQSRTASRDQLVAAGHHALTMLDGLQKGLLEGRVQIRDLEMLAENAAEGSARFGGGGQSGNQDLSDLFDEIALRARVELAKLGR